MGRPCFERLKWPTGQFMVHDTRRACYPVRLVVGLAGLEPATKGFTCPVVSGGSRTISSPDDFAANANSWRVRDALACHQGR
jgi:hypothetical protein